MKKIVRTNMINTGFDKNLFTCEGNLPQDVEFKKIKTANGDKEIAFFSVCTCRKSKEKSVSDRHSFVVKGELINSESLKSLKKGMRVQAEGVLTYVKREGAKFPSAEIQCTSITVIRK